MVVVVEVEVADESSREDEACSGEKANRCAMEGFSVGSQTAGLVGEA